MAVGFDPIKLLCLCGWTAWKYSNPEDWPSSHLLWLAPLHNECQIGGFGLDRADQGFCCEPVLVLVHGQSVPVYPGMDWRDLRHFGALLLGKVCI